MKAGENRCPQCGTFVKRENLPKHLRNVHAMSAEADSLQRSMPKSPRPGVHRRVPTWAVLLLVLIVPVAGIAGYRAAYPAETETQLPLTEMSVQHEGVGVHHHAQLNITILNIPYEIPKDIGIGEGFMRPLHTHDATGVIHIELPTARTAYLRDFFAIWGKTFSSSRILDYVEDGTHEIAFFVNGVPSPAYENLVLADQQHIVIEYRQV